jgi:hypothetical protein
MKKVKKVARLISEVVGVPCAMTIQACPLIDFWTDFALSRLLLGSVQSSFGKAWGTVSMAAYFLGFAMWSEEVQELEKQGLRDERTGWALLVASLCGVILFLWTSALPQASLSPIGRVICSICVFCQQICFWVAMHTGAREFRQIQGTPS